MEYLYRDLSKPVIYNLHWEVGVAVLEYEVGPASLGSGKKAEKGILQEDEMEFWLSGGVF